MCDNYTCRFWNVGMSDRVKYGMGGIKRCELDPFMISLAFKYHLSTTTVNTTDCLPSHKPQVVLLAIGRSTVYLVFLLKELYDISIFLNYKNLKVHTAHPAPSLLYSLTQIDLIFYKL